MEMQELENIRDIYFSILKRKQNSFRKLVLNMVMICSNRRWTCLFRRFVTKTSVAFHCL